MSNRSTWWTMAAMATILAGAPEALAQASSAAKDETAQPQPPRRIRAVRKSVVDLEAMAKERRPGQVMPGDPTPVGRTPVGAPGAGPAAMTGGMEASTLPAADLLPTKGTPIQLPDTAPDSRTIVKPEADPSGRVHSSEPAPAVPAAAPQSSTPSPAMPETVQATAVAGVTDLTSTPRIVTGHAEPLPPMDDVAPEPTPEKPAVDPGVSLVDGAIMPNIPMALSSGSAKVKVESIKGDSSGVQWRATGESWSTLATGDSKDAQIEVRAGLDSDVVFAVDERVQILVARLGRVLIERSTEVGGATAVSVTVSRGAVEIRPMKDAGFSAGEMFARVRTPDQMFGVTGALRVEYDAFTGTRRRTLNP